MDQNSTIDPNRLAEWLKSRIGELIVFDGSAGAGKTTLMRTVAEHLHDTEAIDVDDFLERGRGVFVDAIRFDELRDKVSTALKNKTYVLMATLCARKVVERLGLSKAVFVYVRPADEENSSEAIAEKYGEIESMSHPLHREVEEYHRDYKPFQNADFRYIRFFGIR